PSFDVYTLSLHDALPIWLRDSRFRRFQKLRTCTMTAIQAVLPIASLLSIHVILAHWRVHWQLKFFGEVLGRAPMMFIWDAMAILDRKSTRLNSSHVKISY